MGDPSEFLKWGELGLLALVLIVILLWVRGWLDRSQTFIESIAKAALDSQARSMEMFQTLSKQSIEAHMSATATMREISESFERFTTQVQLDHKLMLERLSKLQDGQVAILSQKAPMEARKREVSIKGGGR